MNIRKMTLIQWVLLALAVACGITAMYFTFTDNWANRDVAELPPLFWVAFLGEVGIVGGIRANYEIQAWRSGKLNGRERKDAPLLIAGIFVLAVALFPVDWNGAKVILLALGLLFTAWGASVVLRGRKFSAMHPSR